MLTEGDEKHLQDSVSIVTTTKCQKLLETSQQRIQIKESKIRTLKDSNIELSKQNQAYETELKIFTRQAKRHKREKIIIGVVGSVLTTLALLKN